MYSIRQFFQKYPATTVLMFINVFFFVITSSKGNTPDVLVDLGALFSPYVSLYHHYWRLITAMFLHSSVTHLLSNMFSLYVVGTLLEPILDRERFVGIYLLSGVMGNAVSFTFGNYFQVSVGASSAIFGYFMSVILLTKLVPHHQGVRALSRQFMGIVLLNIALSFSPNVDFLAHLGGAIGGVIAFYMLGYFQHHRARQIQLLVCYSIIVVVLIIMGSRGIEYYGI